MARCILPVVLLGLLVIFSLADLGLGYESCTGYYTSLFGSYKSSGTCSYYCCYSSTYSRRYCCSTYSYRYSSIADSSWIAVYWYAIAIPIVIIIAIIISIVVCCCVCVAASQGTTTTRRRIVTNNGVVSPLVINNSSSMQQQQMGMMAMQPMVPMQPVQPPPYDAYPPPGYGPGPSKNVYGSPGW